MTSEDKFRLCNPSIKKYYTVSGYLSPISPGSSVGRLSTQKSVDLAIQNREHTG